MEVGMEPVSRTDLLGRTLSLIRKQIHAHALKSIFDSVSRVDTGIIPGLYD
jgi:hypothetical protein